MILQCTKIIGGDPGIEPGTSAQKSDSAVRCTPRSFWRYFVFLTRQWDEHRGVFFIWISQPVNQGLRWVRIINNWRSKISWHTPIKNTCTYCACASTCLSSFIIFLQHLLHIYLLYYVVKPTCITSAIHWSQVTARLLLQRGLQQQHNTQQQHSTQLAEDHSKSEKYHRLEEIFTRWKSCLLYKYSKN